MTFSKLKLPEASVFTPARHIDSRGYFQENFRLSDVGEQVSGNFEVQQVNQSYSKKGVLRGIHWVPGDVGQAKYVTCVSGAILDFVIDLREGSPNFGKWDFTLLSSENGKSLLIGKELGHAFLALEDETIVHYLCSTTYTPGAEITVNPLSPDLGIPFKELAQEHGIKDLVLSKKDSQALGLEQSRLKSN